MEDEEEELDEFGRVKRRRHKFTSERKDTEDGEYDGEEDDRRPTRDYGHDSTSDGEGRPRRYQHRRRRSSSPRRRYTPRSRHSDSEDEKDHDRGRRRRRSSHGYRGQSPEARDPYAAAARYIDTEFFPTKIYVGDLERVSRDELEQAFSRFGPIRQVRMVDGKEYGFITYEDKPSALAAIQSMHGTLLGTRRIKVNRAKIPERNRVGFGNVPWTDEDGALAKEEMQSYPTSRDISPITKPDPREMCPVPGRRALTTYDDL
ncbi:hypothetical protein CLU79DRAFT_382459 [Phycomyces nitens]|nr:hypothetical protein CLU79DRAFT_382459 [Phycomyces nitens]